MAYDESLADRVRRELQAEGVAFEEKRMMGGLCYLVDDKMCVGVHEERLMVRIAPEDEAEFLAEAGAEPMDFTGRPMRGYLWIYDEGMRTPAKLKRWVARALAFNPRAKSSKKKRAG